MSKDTQEPKTTIFYEAVEYPESTNSCGTYQHASIHGWIRTETPSRFSDETFEITYQQHKDPETKEWSAYYAEKIEIPRLDAAVLKQISGVFQKMEAYNKKLSDKGLTLNIYPRGCSFEYRKASLKAISAVRLYRDEDRNIFSHSPVPA